MQRRKIILDTDPGVGIPGTDADDPIALLLALADPRLDLLGVTTTFGNCPPQLGARGAAAVLQAAGRRDVPVAVGEDRPLSGELPELLRAAYAGARGREGALALPPLAEAAIEASAADFIVDTVRAHPGEVTIIAIGPQTNIARALERDPEVARLIHSIVFMGGALGTDAEFGRGNVTPVAECNIWFDPEAAARVFASGIDLTMVSLDVTNPNTGLVLQADEIRSWDPAASTVAAMMSDICRTYLDAPMFEWADGCVLYDPLAVAVAADAGIAEIADLAVAVETRGEFTRGQTVPVPEGTPNLHVCTNVDGRRVVDDIVRTILSSPSRKDKP